MQARTPEIKSKQRKEVLKSYLVIAKPKPPKAPVTELKSSDIEPDSIPIKTEPEQIKSVTKDTKPKTEKVNETVSTVVEPKTVDKIEQIEPPVTTIVPSTTIQKKSPYASARNYLEQFQQQQVSELSKQGFNQLTEVKPINPSRGPKTTEQIINERSNAFAGRGSGIKVVGEFANSDKLIRLHGNCVRITDDPITGGQSWQASNACGQHDEFNGQLQKSLNKYLKK